WSSDVCSSDLFGDHHVGVALDGADEDEVGCLQRDDAGSRLIERVDDLHDLGAVVDAGKMVDVVYLQPVEDLGDRGCSRRQWSVDADTGEQLAVPGPAHTCYHLGDAQLFADQGHQEVVAVVICDGHHHVGVFDALLLEKLDVSPVAAQYQCVRQPLRQLLATLLVL